MKRVVIIGGGISGLAAANSVLEECKRRQGAVELTLVEAAPATGGIIQSRQREGFLLELGPDSFITEKPAGVDLVNRLGLQSRLIETNANFRRSFVAQRGRLQPVAEGFGLLAPTRLLPFLASEIFSWSGKARMALDLLLPRGQTNGSFDESLAHFVRRRLGREALERMAQPMVGGIYTADPETLSMRATMPRFLEMEQRNRSLILGLRRANKLTPGEDAQATGARYSLFLSFDLGMQVLTDELAKRIADFFPQMNAKTERESQRQSRAEIRLNTAVESVTLERGVSGAAPKWKITTRDNKTLTADAVCLAVPAFVSARLLRNVDERISAELDSIDYASSATINLAYNRSDIPHALDGFGFVVPFIEKRTVMACTFSSVKFANRAPENYVLLRAFAGGALQPALLELTDEELTRRVRDDLRDLLGIVRPPLFVELSRWKQAMPQYKVGHLDLVKSIGNRASALPGLTLAGNAYSGPGIPDCISSGERAAEDIEAHLMPENCID